MRYNVERVLELSLSCLAALLPACGGLPAAGVHEETAQRFSGMQQQANAMSVWRLYLANNSDISSYRFGAGDHETLLCRREAEVADGSNIATDKDGNLLIPFGEDGAGLTIYAGPGMCGREIARIGSPSFEPGYAVDAASLNVRTGKIVIALEPPFSLQGGVLACRFTGACSEILPTSYSEPNGAMAVAIDSAGDCWAVAELENVSRSGYDTALVYFQHCEAPGVKATGWINASGGGIDVDQAGNLISVSSGSPSQLYVYRGCKPGCQKIGGPFNLLHEATYGHVSRDNALFASTGGGFVDVYDYGQNTLKHRFSFHAAANSSGVAFSPGR